MTDALDRWGTRLFYWTGVLFFLSMAAFAGCRSWFEGGWR